MKELLTRKLREYIKENNPDLLATLSEEKREEEYLGNLITTVEDLFEQLIKEEKPPYIIEELCMEQLTKPLRPSKYNYVKTIAEEKFPKQCEAFQTSGILRMELINILTICLPLFEVFHFSEDTEDDEHLRYVIITAMKGYFKETEREIVKKWPTTFTIN